MNIKKETFQLVADTVSVVTDQAYIGLICRTLSLLLDLPANEGEALNTYFKYMNEIIHEKTQKGDRLRNDWHPENIGTNAAFRIMKKTFETLKNEVEEKTYCVFLRKRAPNIQ